MGMLGRVRGRPIEELVRRPIFREDESLEKVAKIYGTHRLLIPGARRIPVLCELRSTVTVQPAGPFVSTFRVHARVRFSHLIADYPQKFVAEHRDSRTIGDISIRVGERRRHDHSRDSFCES